MRRLFALLLALAAALPVAVAGARDSTTSDEIVFASNRPAVRPPHRYVLDLRTAKTFEVPVREGALSPDGRWRATIESDTAASRVIVTRTKSGARYEAASFAADQYRIQDVRQLVWSPNSRWLAIVLDVLCSARGATPCNVWDLWAVHPDGTALHEVSLHARTPTWSPDSRRIAFVGTREGDTRQFISIAPVTGGGSHPFAVGGQPSWAPRGDAIAYYGRRGVSLAHVGRRGVRVLARTGLVAPAVWSSDGRRVAFAGETRKAVELIVHDIGRNARVVDRDTSISNVTWSRDGRWIVYAKPTSVTDENARFANQLFVIRSSATGRRQLTRERPWAAFEDVQWARNDNSIVYTTRQTYAPLQLYTMSGDGTGLVQQSDFLNSAHDPTWSPDHTRVAFDEQHVSIEPQVQAGIYAIDLATHAVRQITAPQGRDWDDQPAWSPEGTEIAYVHHTRTDQGSDVSRIEVVPADGGTSRPVTDFGYSVSGPTWSPGGSLIAFVDTDPASPASRAIFTVHRDGTGRQLVLAMPYIFAPAWSPDGKSLAFFGTPDLGPMALFVATADGTKVRQLVRPDYWLSAPAWSPDSASLLYVHDVNYLTSELHMVRIDDSDDTALGPTDGVIRGVDWAP